MMLRLIFALLLSLPLAPAYAQHKHAHGDAKPQHGGQAVEAGDYHVEMVAKGDVIEVHVTDHDDKAVPTTGFKGLAILTADGKSQRIVLAPSGASMLTGKAATALPAAPKGVVQLTPAKGKTVQARFK